MRHRVAIVIMCTVIAYVATSLLWRQVFPFRDGIAQFLPENTIAYAHVNLTPNVRRALRDHVVRLLPDAAPENHDRGFLEQAISAPDVREFAFVWHQPALLPPQFALLIGQRASFRPDVVPPSTFTIGGQELRVLVVRVRNGKTSLGHVPVQATLWPRSLPFPALAAVSHLFPETIVASGTIGRDGFALRSNGRWMMPFRTTRRAVLVTPREGALQLMDVPIRALMQQLEIPLHRDLARAIESVLPESTDVVVDLNTPGVAIQLPWSPAVGTDTEDALRALAARIWPMAHSGGFIADPASIRVVSVGSRAWEVHRGDPPSPDASDGRGEVVAFASVSDGVAIIASRRDLLEETISFNRQSSIKIPRGCAISSRYGTPMMIVDRVHPQIDAVLLVDRMWKKFTVCGRLISRMD